MAEDLLAALLVFAVLRWVYKTFIEPGWKKSRTYKDWERRNVR